MASIGTVQAWPVRPTRLATTATSSSGSTGLATWTWNPASMARRRSSERANAVRATAGRSLAERAPGADLADQVVAVRVGHADVADQHVEAVAGPAGRGPRAPSLRPAPAPGCRRARGGSGRARRARRRRPARGCPPAAPAAKSISPAAGSCGRTCRRFLLVVHDQQRQRHGERAPLALAGALGPHGAPVHLDQLLDDRQAQSQAAVPPRGRAVGLAEPVEDVRQELGLDPDARVGDADLDVRVDPLEQDLDPAALRA